MPLGWRVKDLRKVEIGCQEAEPERAAGLREVRIVGTLEGFLGNGRDLVPRLFERRPPSCIQVLVELEAQALARDRDG